MTYPEVLERLAGLRRFGWKLGLDTMREFARRLENPEAELRFIHIAGTNGKGSVAAFCASLLAAAGHRAGSYTSPHLVALGERFQLDGRPISEADLCRLVARLWPVVEELAAAPQFRSPTFFEVMTALALLWFREQRPAVVVWETGLGGRLDATNIVTPLVSVITNIGWDHVQHLGPTLADIAREKCGIIKPGIPVVTAAGQVPCGSAPTSVLEVIRTEAAARGARLTEVTAPLDASLPLGLPGEHQRWNAATALAALAAAGLSVSGAALADGLRNVNWPGRFQVLPGEPAIVLDGAHNPPAARALAGALRERFADRRLTLILGVLQDKDAAGVCAELAPIAERIVLTPVQSDRAGDPAALAGLCRAANPQAGCVVATGLADALAEARQGAVRPGDAIVVTGSLFLVGEALALLEPARARPGERGLQ